MRTISDDVRIASYALMFREWMRLENAGNGRVIRMAQVNLVRVLRAHTDPREQAITILGYSAIYIKGSVYLKTPGAADRAVTNYLWAILGRWDIKGTNYVVMGSLRAAWGPFLAGCAGITNDSDLHNYLLECAKTTQEIVAEARAIVNKRLCVLEV